MDNLQEKIARRAYELFQARGGEHGYHMADWFQAEKEILGLKGASAGRPKTAAKTSSSAVGKAPAVTTGRKKATARK
jgi:hypothetical protein